LRWTREIGQNRRPRSVAFSPDGTRVAATTAELTICLWDTDTSDELLTLRGQNRGSGSATWLRLLAWLADGDTLVTAGSDGVVRFWDITAQQERAVLERIGDLAPAGARDRTGNLLAVGAGNQHIYFLDPHGSTERAAVQVFDWPAFSRLALSPQGDRLAWSAHGRVLLWDVTRIPLRKPAVAPKHRPRARRPWEGLGRAVTLCGSGHDDGGGAAGTLLPRRGRVQFAG
jgi:WD40 repeat protein